MRPWTFYLIARFLTACVLFGWLLSILLIPSSGAKEFRRSLEALKKVNSIHYAMVADVPAQHTEEEADLVCSDDSFHSKSHAVLHQRDKDLTFDSEVLRSGGQDYRLQANGLWKRGYSGVDSAKMTCTRLAQGSRAWITPEIDELLEHSIIEKGEKKTVNGEVCREWKVTARFGVAYQRTLCLGTKDHLPREMVANGARWTYAFNIPIKIQPPTALEPEHERDTYRPPDPGLTLSDDNDAN